MKISAIFSDYDGTLAPEDVLPDASCIAKDVEGPLVELSAAVPVAIVTSKDIGFVRPRTGFARAWACASGLEVVLSDGRTSAAAPAGDRVREGIRYIKRRDRFGLAIELKRSSTNALLGFSVDWRRRPAPTPEFLRAATSALTEMGLSVSYDPSRPFVDVFGARPDKGQAVRELKRLLRVDGKVLFMGDSIADNPAFDEADVGLCVDHGQDLGGIESRFSLRAEGLPPFLRSLVDSNLSLDIHALRLR